MAAPVSSAQLSRRRFLQLLAGVSCGVPAFASALFPSDVFSAMENPTAFLPTRERPLLVDDKLKMVMLYAEVNGKGLASSNPHWGVVFRGGRLHDKAILKTYARPDDFHDALVRIGARPGNTMSEKSYGISVSGDVLDVSITWQGLGGELRLSDVFSDESGKGFQIRFGGNRQAAVAESTGCITCLESCWIGVTSTARYPYISSLCRTFVPNSRFRGKEEVLPAGGKPVILIYRVAAVRP